MNGMAMPPAGFMDPASFMQPDGFSAPAFPPMPGWPAFPDPSVAKLPEFGFGRTPGGENGML